MKTQPPILDSSRQGIVMMSMMVLFGIMSLMTVAVFIVAQTDIQILTQYKRGQNAFFNAEAALQIAKAEIENSLLNGSLLLDSTTESVLINPPPDFDFEPIRTLTRLADENMYYLVVTGKFDNARAIIETAFRRQGLFMDLGIFGDETVRLQPNGEVLSYRSSETTSPTTSTGEAGVGSNETVTFLPGVDLDGTVMLGQDAGGNPATGPSSSSYTVEHLGEYINPDPLGANGGELEEATIYYRNPSNNNNSDAIPAINNNSVNGSVYLPPGNYYLDSFRIGANKTLEVGGTPDNPVNIFFEGSGEFRVQPNANIVYTSGTPAPTTLRIFSTSSSMVRFQPKLDVRALVYAPNAEVRIQPNGDFYGAVWGKDVRMQPRGDFWIDLTLLNEYMSTSIEYTQWKEVRAR